MKNIFIIIVLIITSSCSDFLSENVRGVISPNNFYNSDQEAIQASNGLYLDFRSANLYQGWQGITAYSMFGSDEMMSSRIFGGLAPILDYNLTETNYGNAYDIWRDLYTAIGDANSVMTNVKGNNKISKVTQDLVIGETLFLRALAYYHLTALWGDVPYFLEDLPLDQVAVLGRTDMTKIRTQMVEDLILSESLLPSANQGDKVGRATKWSAKFLRTRFYLWQKNWTGALATSQDIINNSPHKLMAKYADIFNVNKQFNEEAIFGFDFQKDVPNNSQDITDSFNPRLRDEPMNASLRNEFAAKMLAQSEEFNGYGLNVPLNDLIDKFPKDDLRRPLTLFNEYLGYKLNFTYLKKRTNFNFVTSPRGNHGEAWITMRLGQVYLMAAEAANELNKNAESLAYANKIRERAYSPAKPLNLTSQTELRKAIQDEYKWELAGESERRYDLIRWGILVETIKGANYGIFKGNVNIKPHMVKLPIPQQEIVLNPALLKSDPTNNGYR